MTEQRIVLEEAKRLSDSILWRMQTDFYDHHGLDAWRKDIIPHVVTNNMFMARAFARVVFGFLRDWQAQLDPTEPIYMIEPGAGPGRFAFHFLKQWLHFYPQSVLKNQPFCYVLTDFAGENLAFWQEHPKLKLLVEAGHLDFALVDATKDAPIRLLHSGKVLTPETVKNPIVVVCNYFFDSLPQDMFAAKESLFCEGRVKVSQIVTEKNDPGLNNIKLAFELHPINPATYYEDADYTALLQEYAQSFTDTWLLFPTAGFEFMRSIQRLANGRWFLLTADKGYHLKEDLVSRDEPHFNLHGSFSLMVNFHALGAMARAWGGDMLHPQRQPINLDICALTGTPPPNGFIETRQAYLEYIEQLSPDDFYNFKMFSKGEDDPNKPTVTQILAHIRFSGWDAIVLLRHFPDLFGQLKGITDAMKNEVRHMVYQVYEHYYSIGEEFDVPFTCAALLSGTDFYQDALPFFFESLEFYGRSPETLYNLAICYACLTDYDQAIHWSKEALIIAPEHGTARRLLEQLEKMKRGD